MKTWVERILELEASGWTLTMLAEHCGIAYSTLCDVKNKHTKEPRGMAAVKLHALEGKAPPAASRKKAA